MYQFDRTICVLGCHQQTNCMSHVQDVDHCQTCQQTINVFIACIDIYFISLLTENIKWRWNCDIIMNSPLV